MSYLDRYVSLPLNNKSKFTEFINEVLSDYYGTKFADGEVLIYASTKLVGPEVIEEAIIMRDQTDGKRMLVITNSRFSQQATELAKNNWIMLMDEAVLLDVINQLDQGKRHGATIKENICQIASDFEKIKIETDEEELDKLFEQIKANNDDLRKVNKASHKMLDVLQKELAKMQQFEKDNNTNYGSKYLSDVEPDNLLLLKMAERTKKYNGLLSDRADTLRFVRHIIERCNINQMKYEDIKEQLETEEKPNLNPTQLSEYNELKNDFIDILSYQIEEMNRGIDYMGEVKQVNDKLTKTINDFKENDKVCIHKDQKKKINMLVTILILIAFWLSLNLIFGPIIATLATVCYFLIRQ